MAWTDLSGAFGFGTVLTSSQMQQLRDNDTALANGDTGAPRIVVAALDSTDFNTNFGQGYISASAIGQGELKSTTASQSASVAAGDLVTITPTGGDYSIFCTLGTNGLLRWSGNGSSTFNSAVGIVNTGSSTYTALLFSRYVQASPPYNYGAGDVPLFVMAMLDKNTREVLATYAAEDPPWAYHGQHLLHPVLGKLQKYVGIWGKDPRRVWAGQDAMPRDEYMAALRRLRNLSPEEKAQALAQEFTMDEKMADMDVVPHLFDGFDPSKHIVVQLDPLTTLCEDLHCLMMTPGAPNPSELLHDGSLKIVRDIPSAKIQKGVVMVEGSL